MVYYFFLQRFDFAIYLGVMMLNILRCILKMLYPCDAMHDLALMLDA